MAEVQIPSKAVSVSTDILQPTRTLLEDLNLLGTSTEVKAAGTFSAIFTGPAQSVALIEAGATSAAKWWATGLGAAVIAAWGSVVAWWGDQADNVKIVALAGAAFVTAALVASIGHLIASDVRGRAAAAVATINARASVAETMMRAAESVYDTALPESAVQIVALPAAIGVKNTEEPAANEDGWLAIALERHPDGSIKYIVVKGSTQASVTVEKLQFS